MQYWNRSKRYDGLLSLKCKFNGQRKEMRKNTVPPSALAEKQEQINDVGKIYEGRSKCV